MKLLDILLIGLSIAFLVIGVDQSIAYGFQQSYWAFMLALLPFFIFSYRRNRKPADEAAESRLPKKKKK
jgi:uncharacterized membrane-anchored protein YitT (DUF2179 family)